MKKNLLCLLTLFVLALSTGISQAQTAKKVAYITADREFAMGASTVTDDAIIKMLQADENFEVTVMAVAMDSVFDNLAEFDLAVIQESFYSTAAILKPTGSAGLAKIPIPFIFNKCWALKDGRALVSGGATGGANGTGLTITVEPSNQSNELFNGITFTDNTFDAFKEGASSTGEVGENAYNFASGLDLSKKNTLLATLPDMTSGLDSTIFINDFPIGSKIGSEQLAARMIAIGMSFGAIIKDDGDNFTQNGITLWRNALYSLAGLTVPTTPYEPIVEEVPYAIKIDFGPGSNNTTEPGWSNVYMESTEAQKVELIDSEGDSTGIMVYWHDDIIGINNGGTTEPKESVGMPSTATMDNLYCNGQNRTAGLTFENFDLNYYYNFEVFASRMGATDNREAKYTVAGANSVVGTLNPSDNDSAFAVIEGVYPNAEGTITLDIDKGDNHEEAYYYLYIGAMRITRTLITANNEFDFNAEEVKIYPIPFTDQVNLSKIPAKSTLSIYSITGTKVIEIQAKNDKTRINTSSLKSGVYVLHVKVDGKTISAHKLIKK